MILNNEDIQDYAVNQKMITPFNESQLNGASYDVAVGDSAKVLTQKGFVDLDFSNTTKENPYKMKPNERLLVATLEKFIIPGELRASFALRSSPSREFLQHMFAGFIDPGYYNSVMTLELINWHPFNDMLLYRGLLIGQVEFAQLTKKATISYRDKGTYNNASRVESSNKPYSEPVIKLLVGLSV